MTILTKETACDYVSNLFAAYNLKSFSISYAIPFMEDGTAFIRVEGHYNGNPYECDCWLETREDGSQYIYGEW